MNAFPVATEWLAVAKDVVSRRLIDIARDSKDEALRGALLASFVTACSSVLFYLPFRDVAKEVRDAATEGTTGRPLSGPPTEVALSPAETPSTQIPGIIGSSEAMLFPIPPPPGTTSPSGGYASQTSSSLQQQMPKQSPLKQFLALLSIAFPRFKSRQGRWLVALTIFLLIRTQLSIRISRQIGVIAKCAIQGQRQPFVSALLLFVVWSIPAAVVNSGIKYFTGMLQVSMREHLARYLHGRYLNPKVFFKLAGLGGADSIEQRITQDTQRWSDQAASLYTILFKPLLDIVLFSRDIASMDGGRYRGPLMIGCYYGLIAPLMRLWAPDFGLLASMQAQKDNDLRQRHQLLLEYADEVVCSEGNAIEKQRVDALFVRTNRHAIYTVFVKSVTEVFESLFVRSGSLMVGYAVCGGIAFSMIPSVVSEAGGVGSSASSREDVAQVTGMYARSSAMLTNLARSIGQVMLAYRSVSILRGLTERVYALEYAVETEERNQRHARHAVVDAHGPGRAAEILSSSNIQFDHVNLRTPVLSNAPLVNDLSFYVKPGMNLLVIGPNGSGKSSTFRVLAGLWPLLEGIISKPSVDQLYYVSQRPYMSSGTLRDQLIYPIRAKELKVGESTLYEYMELVGLDHLFDRPKMSWDANLMWSGEALSMGEKQKLALARMFFHRPRFAFLDECTSAVDLDVERRVYEACQARSITVISIAHRQSVWQYHNWVLKLDGQGGYVFSPMKLTEESSNGQTSMYLTYLKVAHASDKRLEGATYRELVSGDGVSATIVNTPSSSSLFGGGSTSSSTVFRTPSMSV